MMEFTMRLTGIILPFSTYIVGVARSCLHLTVHLRLLDKREISMDKSDNHGSTSKADCDVG
jgi:hypothetical protein